MKARTPIARIWETALRWLVNNGAARQFDAEAPTLAGVVISGAQATEEAWPHQATLPPGCAFAVRYVSR